MVVIVCLTAGICEEALYGGSCCTIFNFLPFHLSLTRARVLPSVIFGIEHCYQGVVIKAWPARGRRRRSDFYLRRCCWPREICCCRWRCMQCWTARDGASSEGVCPCGGESRHQVDRSKIPILLMRARFRMGHPQRHRGSVRSEKIARRGFLKTAGVALGGSALIALPERAIALGAAENNFAYEVRAFGALFSACRKVRKCEPVFRRACRARCQQNQALP